MRDHNFARPAGLIAVAVASLALGLFLVVLAVLSVGSEHGGFSYGVAAALVVWAGFVVAGGLLLWRGRGWARGIVVAAGLMNLFAFGQMVPSNGFAILGAAAGLACVVGPLLPTTRAALTREG